MCTYYTGLCARWASLFINEFMMWLSLLRILIYLLKQTGILEKHTWMGVPWSCTWGALAVCCMLVHTEGR